LRPREQFSRRIDALGFEPDRLRDRRTGQQPLRLVTAPRADEIAQRLDEARVRRIEFDRAQRLLARVLLVLHCRIGSRKRRMKPRALRRRPFRRVREQRLAVGKRVFAVAMLEHEKRGLRLTGKALIEHVLARAEILRRRIAPLQVFRPCEALNEAALRHCKRDIVRMLHEPGAISVENRPITVALVLGHDTGRPLRRLQ
jgi:hypothetical protein